jgi:phosphoglucosamine mutase
MGDIFGTDGIRDKAGHGFLAPDKIVQVARASGLVLKKSPGSFRAAIPKAFLHLKTAAARRGPGRGRVIIGRDTRASGPGIEASLAAGFQSVGVDVGLAGVISTPGVATLTRLWGGALGVVISASHNPAEDNGIKLISPQGFKIPDAAEEAIEKLLRGKPVAARVKRPAAAVDLSAQTDDYLDFLTPFSRSLKGMKLVIDCGHGASSAFADRLFKRLGASVVVLHNAPDGKNINAGCGALHPEKVAEAVRREKADAGVAFDGDADRAIFVDEKGEVRDGETVLSLCGLHFKEKKALPKNTIVSTVMANFGLERHLAAHGISLRRTKVGDRFVAEDMLKSAPCWAASPPATSSSSTPRPRATGCSPRSGLSTCSPSADRSSRRRLRQVPPGADQRPRREEAADRRSPRAPARPSRPPRRSWAPTEEFSSATPGPSRSAASWWKGRATRW